MYDLKRVVESISNLKGASFYDAICLSLSEVLGASHVFIAHVNEANHLAKTFSLAAHQQIIENINYDPTHTPCYMVSLGSTSSYNLAVQQLFPKAELFISMETEAYIGVPLISASGKAGTILVVLFQHPVDNIKSAESLLLLFKGLIQREIEKDKVIAKLDFSNQLIEQSHEAIFVCNKDVEITYVNTAFTKMTGYTFAEVKGKNPSILSSNQHDHYFYKAMWHQIDTQGKWSGEITNKTKLGELYTQFLSINLIKSQCETCYVAFILDITEKKEAEKKIYFHANHDQLTGITNRFYFKEYLCKLIFLMSYREQPTSYLAVIYFDIDKFRNINTVYGLTFGDNLLCKLANRLASEFNVDVFSRIDGDSFAIIRQYSELNELEQTCKQIGNLLAAPFSIGGINQQVSVTLGISTYEGGDNTFTEKNIEKIARRLIRQAELAALNAKQTCFEYLFFTAEMDEKVKYNNLLVEQLRNAVDEEEIVVYFQPIIDVTSQKVVKFESLVRWFNNGQWISPDQFIPLAEESRIIIPLGEFVLKKTCEKIRELKQLGYDQLVFNVNRSIFEFTEFNCERNAWLELLTKYNVPAKQLSFELTESVLAPENASHLETLAQLKRAGCEISIDDFGTGYSSLSYLRRFPVDVLKIDKSFIDDIHINASDRALTKSIIQMSRALNIKVVAEGVEYKEQFEILKSFGCDYIQGYYFSKPLPESEILPFLAQCSQ